VTILHVTFRASKWRIEKAAGAALNPLVFRIFHLGARAMSTRTYRDAINNLNSLQSNAAALAQVRASGGRTAFVIPEMLEYLGIIGYKVCLDDLIIPYAQDQ
jgi:hypothetical protein